MPSPSIRHWHADGLEVDTDFPGGNLLVESIADGTLTVRQDRRDTPQHWFYWACRLRGAAGQRLSVRFTDGRVVGVRGPAVSDDDGATWRWLDAEAGEIRDAFTYDVPAGADAVRFAMGIPHQVADWERFAAARPALRRSRLCLSRRGRAVESAAAGDPAAPWLLLLTARHHCCEAMAGYALEGLVDAVLQDPAWPALAEVVAIPFVDLDGVEDGDQGKNRAPRDHGRDYLGDSLYPETAAIRAGLPRWCAGRRAVVVDLHCPYIKREPIYQVGAEEPAVWAQQRRLAAILAEVRRGPLPYRPEDDLPFGQAWNIGANYDTGRGIRRWSCSLPEVAFATSFEVPYADAHGVAVLPETARPFGRDLAATLKRMLGEGFPA